MGCGKKDDNNDICGETFICGACHVANERDVHLGALNARNQELSDVKNERDCLAARIWGLNDQVDDLEDEVQIMSQALNAIAKDNPCGQHHDAMAQEALKDAFASGERPARAKSPSDIPSSERPAKHQSHCRASEGFTCSCVKTSSITKDFI